MILKLIIIIALVILTILFIFDDRKKLFPKLGMILLVLIYIVIVFHATPSLKATNFLESFIFRGEITDSENVDNKYIVVRERENGAHNSIRFYTYGKFLGFYYKDKRNIRLVANGFGDTLESNVTFIKIEIKEKVVIYASDLKNNIILIKLENDNIEVKEKELIVVDKEELKTSTLIVNGEERKWNPIDVPADFLLVSSSLW